VKRTYKMGCRCRLFSVSYDLLAASSTLEQLLAMVLPHVICGLEQWFTVSNQGIRYFPVVDESEPGCVQPGQTESQSNA
jgi:hypothetical protein